MQRYNIGSFFPFSIFFRPSLGCTSFPEANFVCDSGNASLSYNWHQNCEKGKSGKKEIKSSPSFKTARHNAKDGKLAGNTSHNVA
jgi:hypothetical protein